MPTQKFEIRFPTALIGLTILMISLSLLALYLWHAPLPYRLTAMTIALILSLVHLYRLKKYYYRHYPLVLTLKNDHWHLNEQPVKLQPSSLLTPYYAAIHLRSLTKKRYYLIMTHMSFRYKEDYYNFIRLVKTHRGSA